MFLSSPLHAFIYVVVPPRMLIKSGVPYAILVNLVLRSMADKKITNELNTDYKLVGIASSLKEYKLCYHLNLLLNCDFKKLTDLVFEPTDRSRKIQFSVFKGCDEHDKNQFIVFSNKNLNEVLLPEISNFDYILQLHGKFEPDELKEVIDGIKEFPQVIMTAEIPIKKIKSKERLVYEEERVVQKLIAPKKFF
ncbi:MAG: IPExxxVDY family protein [Chitinophagales bacterium]|nr:IPExxxVDY family protein [Chitinophagales bacterium]